jgi:hypothetical protein
MTGIGTIIGWKFDHQQGMCTKNGVITAFPGGIPSQADQDKWTKEYEDYMVSIAYKEKRKPEYGSWEDQMDMMYHGTWEAHVQAVKEKHPKE